MKVADAIASLQALEAPAVTTGDAAALFGASVAAANRTLGRLERSGLVRRIKRGLWAVDQKLDAHRAVPYLTAPYDSYLSLQSALYLRGVSSQIPALTYVVSLDRPRILKTPLGTFSIHRVAPELFGGYQLESGAPLATPEKALVDLLYLSAAGGSELLAALPELELPRKVKRAARTWIAKIRSLRLRTMVETRFNQLE